MIPHIEENGEAYLIVAISTEGRKAAAEIMGTVSLGNKSIKGVAQVREANKENPPLQEKSPLQKFMEQTPKLIIPTDIILKGSSVAGHEVKVLFDIGNIGITVDDSYTKGNISPQEGKKVAIRAMRMVKKEVAKMPDGTLLTNTPTTADGLGSSRASLYESAGFGSIGGDDIMRSVVKKGKLTPISAEQYGYLMNNGHHN